MVINNKQMLRTVLAILFVVSVVQAGLNSYKFLRLNSTQPLDLVKNPKGAIVFDWRPSWYAIHSVMIMRLTDGKLWRITDGSRISRVPSWSKSGEEIAFENWDENGVYLSIARLKHNGITVSNSRHSLHYPRFNSSGQIIVGFIKPDREAAGRIGLLNRSTDELSLLKTSSENKLFDPLILNGSDLYTFTQQGPTNSNILISRVKDGTNIWTSDDIKAAHSTQSHEGSLLVWRSSLTDGRGRVVVQSWQNSTINETYEAPFQIRHPSFSPDDKFVVAHANFDTKKSRPILIDRMNGEYLSFPHLPRGNIQNVEWIAETPPLPENSTIKFSFQPSGLNGIIKRLILSIFIALSTLVGLIMLARTSKRTTR